MIILISICIAANFLYGIAVGVALKSPPPKVPKDETPEQAAELPVEE